MNFYKWFAKAIFLLQLCTVFNISKSIAQASLPDISCVTQNGINIITWQCPYDGVKSISVERSNDSIFNFTTIGFVKNTSKGVQFFIDGHPLLGTNWYRIKLIFGSDVSWTSNRVKVFIDSSQILQQHVMPSNDSLQKIVKGLITTTFNINDTTALSEKLKGYKISNSSNLTKGGSNNLTISIPDISQVNSYTYIRSRYIFSNPFTGHVNIEIANAKANNYSVLFFNSKNEKLFEIPKINDDKIIVDKRNFQQAGVFKFELYKNKTKFETGFITIY